METEEHMWAVGDLRSGWLKCSAPEAYERGMKWTRDWLGEPIPGRSDVRVYRRLVEEVDVSCLTS